MVKDFIMGTPPELINLLECEANAFKLYLTTLSENDWMHPSACDGWTVAHVVAHVVGQDFSLRIRRGLSGDTSPPPGSPDPEDHDEDKFAQVIFERAFSTVDALGKNFPHVLMILSRCLSQCALPSGIRCVTGLRVRRKSRPC